MELTIALFFFTLACAVCIQLFVQAHTLNKEAAAVSKAQTICSSVADEYLAGNMETDELIDRYKGDYDIVLIEQLDGSLSSLDISVCDKESGETFCSLTVSKHKRLEVTEE